MFTKLGKVRSIGSFSSAKVQGHVVHYDAPNSQEKELFFLFFISSMFVFHLLASETSFFQQKYDSIYILEKIL